MALKIHLKGEEGTPEYESGLTLRNIFNEGLQNSSIEGEILIVSNVTLFGCEVKDVDLVVMGRFEKFSETLKTSAVTKKEDQEKDRSFLSLRKREVYINDFCFVIETKNHSADRIKLDGQCLKVKYRQKWSDVTTQSERQKYSLINFFIERLGKSPYVCNFIWFRNINWSQLGELVQVNGNETSHNYLPSEFSHRFLFQLACIQAPPYAKYDSTRNKFRSSTSFSSFARNSFNLRVLQECFDFFTAEKKITGILTRKKIEKITSHLLKEQKYAKAIGKVLLVIAGRAGTGKTIKLLNIAFDLCSQRGDRCLVLTYNHALVSDIKRILAIADVPDGVDNETIQISTLHKFFYELFIGLQIFDKDLKNNFLEKYDNYLGETIKYIRAGLIEEKDIQDLMTSRHEQVAWDYIFVDESQDWSKREKEVLFTLFGPERIIIADGVDQMVRSHRRCNWTSGMGRIKNTEIVEEIQRNKYWKQTERISLRQKTGLVDFINSFAEEVDVQWSIERLEDLPGGSVIVSTQDYSKEFHKLQSEYLLENENTPYEMLFLVPPSLVEKRYNSKQKSNSGRFKLIDDFTDMGIKVWDGTNRDLRVAYSTDVMEHRVLQYDSCRGLEGWTVVCMHFDDFIQYKSETYKEDTNSINLFNEGNSPEERRREFVNLWSLIPLTRAVDRLIITIRDRESDVCKTLRNLHSKRPDLVDWLD